MLLTKEVEVVLNGANQKHYNDKGYLIPKFKNNRGNYTTPLGTTIKVEIKDVPLQSDVVFVEVLCDYCKINISRKTYQKYNNQRDIIEKDCCDACKMHKYEEICYLKNGYAYHNWKGGITPLHNYLRGKINNWKQDSLKLYDYCCGITNIKSKDLEIHHKYGFSTIMDETLFELNLDVRSQVKMYSNKELQSIEKLLLEKHYKYGLGIPILSCIHDLYHKIYGKGNNTPEEFEVFKNDYINDKYKDLKGVS